MIFMYTNDGVAHHLVGILPRLLQELHVANILTEDLAVPEDPDDFEAIYRGLCHIPNKDSKRRRIDFLTVPWKSKGAALLYYTVSILFLIPYFTFYYIAFSRATILYVCLLLGSWLLLIDLVSSIALSA